MIRFNTCSPQRTFGNLQNRVQFGKKESTKENEPVATIENKRITDENEEDAKLKPWTPQSGCKQGISNTTLSTQERVEQNLHPSQRQGHNFDPAAHVKK